MAARIAPLSRSASTQALTGTSGIGTINNNAGGLITSGAVSGATGISKDVSWALQSMVTDAGYLNAAQITTLINATSTSRFINKSLR